LSVSSLHPRRATEIICDSLSVSSWRVCRNTYKTWKAFSAAHGFAAIDVTFDNVRAFISQADAEPGYRQHHEAVKSFFLVKVSECVALLTLAEAQGGVCRHIFPRMTSNRNALFALDKPVFDQHVAPIVKNTARNTEIGHVAPHALRRTHITIECSDNAAVCAEARCSRAPATHQFLDRLAVCNWLSGHLLNAAGLCKRSP